MSGKKPPFPFQQKRTIFQQRIPGVSELISIGQKKAEDDAGIIREKSAYGKTGELNMACTPAERELAMMIAARGHAFMRKYKIDEDVLTAAMDVITVHLNDRRLRLLDFLQAEVTEFAHDYSRIRRCLNRTTGRLSAEVTQLCFEEARH